MGYFIKQISFEFLEEIKKGKPLYTLGKYRPYWRTVDFPPEIRNELSMSSKFQIGDCVKLVHMVYPYLDYEGRDAIVIHLQLVQAMYSSFYTYTVSVDDGFGTISSIEDLLESNLELRAASEPLEVWPPKCICETWQLASAGCSCGAMQKEREIKAKGLVPNGN
jgi:hypothetical protein